MTKKITTLIITGILAISLTGCGKQQPNPPAQNQDTEAPTSIKSENSESKEYQGWKDYSHGPVEFKIPGDCFGEPAMGSRYFSCGNDNSVKSEYSFRTGSDGEVIGFTNKHLDSEKWQLIIKSIKIITPLKGTAQIGVSGEKDE